MIAVSWSFGGSANRYRIEADRLSPSAHSGNRRAQRAAAMSVSPDCVLARVREVVGGAHAACSPRPPGSTTSTSTRCRTATRAPTSRSRCVPCPRPWRGRSPRRPARSPAQWRGGADGRARQLRDHPLAGRARALRRAARARGTSTAARSRRRCARPATRPTARAPAGRGDDADRHPRDGRGRGGRRGARRGRRCGARRRAGAGRGRARAHARDAAGAGRGRRRRRRRRRARRAAARGDRRPARRASCRASRRLRRTRSLEARARRRVRPSATAPSFLVEGAALDAVALEASLQRFGDCVLVVGDRDALKVHVHTDDPGGVLQSAPPSAAIGRRRRGRHAPPGGRPQRAPGRRARARAGRVRPRLRRRAASWRARAMPRWSRASARAAWWRAARR